MSSVAKKKVLTAGDGYGNGYGDGNGDGNGYGNGEIEIEESAPILAYHFVPKSGLIRHEHGGERPRVEVGLVLEWDGPIVLCQTGLHASLEIEQARKYCDGILTRVACSGRLRIGEDKLVCSRREVIEVLGEV